MSTEAPQCTIFFTFCYALLVSCRASQGVKARSDSGNLTHLAGNKLELEPKQVIRARAGRIGRGR
jgi:hypothetical protein